MFLSPLQNVLEDSWLFAATLRRADGVLLVYDVTDPSTLAEAVQTKETIEGILRDYPVKDARDQDVKRSLPFLLVGNKTDLVTQRKVTSKDGRRAALQSGCYFDEASARAGHRDIDRAVALLIHMMRVRSGAQAQAEATLSTQTSMATPPTLSMAIRRASVIATIPTSRSFGPDTFRFDQYAADDNFSPTWKKRSHENIRKPSRRITESIRMHWCRLQLRFRGASNKSNAIGKAVTGAVSEAIPVKKMPKRLISMGRKPLANTPEVLVEQE